MYSVDILSRWMSFFFSVTVLPTELVMTSLLSLSVSAFLSFTSDETQLTNWPIVPLWERYKWLKGRCVAFKTLSRLLLTANQLFGLVNDTIGHWTLLQKWLKPILIDTIQICKKNYSEIRWRVKDAVAGCLTYDGGGKIDSALQANFNILNLVPPGPFYPNRHHQVEFVTPISQQNRPPSNHTSASVSVAFYQVLIFLLIET